MDQPSLRLTTAKQDILSVLAARPSEEFFVNELIRLTGRFPNSIEAALKLLAKDKLILEHQTINHKFFRINPNLAIDVKEQIPDIVDFDWVKLLNRETAYAFNPVLCKSNLTNLQEIYGAKLPTFWTNGFTFGVYYLRHELAELADKISLKLKQDPNFGQKDVSVCRKTCDDLVSSSKNLFQTNFEKLNNHQLAVHLANFSSVYQNIFPFLVTPHIVERYFEQMIKDKVVAEQTLSILLTPVSTEDEERDDALKLAAHVKKSGFDKKFDRLLIIHWQNFCWLSLWSLNAQPLSKDYFLQEVKNILEKIPDPNIELERLKKEEVTRKELFEKTLKKLRKGRFFEDHARMLQEYIFLRTYRKNAISRAHYYHLPLLYEIAKRLTLTNQDVKLLSYDELIDCLMGKKSIKQCQDLIRSRKFGWSILMWQGKTTTVTGSRRIVETMEQFGIVAPTSLSTKMIKGNPACRGKVTGKVKIVHDLSELNKIQPGDILVTKMTTPDYMVAMNRCAGIITDEGGITCHAAIVSREFNIPCVVATHTATKTLKDNDLVELNANEGIIRIIEKTNVDLNIKEIKGKPVYPGKVKGRAVIVSDANDFSKVQSGDILITSQPTPDFLSSLYRVSGMVIDEDSLTSHGVLYAQSLKIPTIMGTGNAREIISDGEIINLDAINGNVKKEKD